MYVTQEQFDVFGNWLINAQLEAKERQKRDDYKRLTNRELYSIDDYSIRKKGDHYESFNTITGEGLFEAFSIEEAMRDLREEFGVT